MVKINTICRSESNYSRETKHDIMKIQRNTNPTLHQFQKAREYQRALVSAKMDKIFAKPFIGSMPGHSDAISTLSKCPQSLTKLLSGSYDGEVRCWDLSTRNTLFSLNIHKNSVKGLTFSPDGNRFASSGDDKIVNLYDYQALIQSDDVNTTEPMQKYMSKQPLGSIDHSWKTDEFATCGQVVQIWNYNRTNPVYTFQWGADSILNVKYNPSQPNILVGTGIDRSIVLYDIRGETPLGKIQLPNKSHAICWNPTEPINFTIGSDDANAYSFDMRNMKEAKFIHKDHIGAIMDLDYSPTGKEFVTGSYDKTIRIFNHQQGRSREVYHGKRMQIIYSVLWTMDNEYILSGSDDMNIRIWKSQASKPIGAVSKREENSLNYKQAVQEKFKHVKEIKRIQAHRHLPKYILNAKKRMQEKKESKHRKQKNVEIYNQKQWKKPKPERKSKVIKEEQ